MEAELRAEAEAIAKAAVKAPARAAVSVPSQVQILAEIKTPAATSKPSPSVQIPSAPPSSGKKKRKRNQKKKLAASRVAPVSAPATQAPQPLAKRPRPLARYEQPEVDHRLAPLSVPGPSSAVRGPQQQHQRQPTPPASRGLPTAGRPATRQEHSNLSRREQAKALYWKQRKRIEQQRQVERSAVDATAGRVHPRWGLAVAAAAANPPTLPPVVPLPPYPASQTALSRLGPALSSVQRTNATPDVTPTRLQPPTEFQMFGGPASPARQQEQGPLIDLSPPQGQGASALARQSVRLEASQMQSAMRRSYVNNDPLSRSVHSEFDASFPPMDLLPVDVRAASQESPMPASRPRYAAAISSTGDLGPLPPSAGLRGITSKQQDLMGAVEREARRMSALHNQLTQADINVHRLRREMQFVNRQIWATQSRDCDPHQPHDADQEAFLHLPFGDLMDQSTTEDSPTRRSGLITSPLEDEGLDAD